MKKQSITAPHIPFIGFLCTALIVVVFSAWFGGSPQAAGDWRYYYPEAIAQFEWVTAWDIRHSGLGESFIQILPVSTYFTSAAKFAFSMGLSWVWYERMFWFFPFVIFGWISSTLLYRRLFPEDTIGRLVMPVIYLTNTYSLMIMAGGQMGVAMSFALLPLGIDRIIQVPKAVRAPIGVAVSHFAGTALVLGLISLFDIRLAALAIAFAALFIVFTNPRSITKRWKSYGVYSVGTAFSVMLIHSFWIIPLVVHRMNPLNTPAFQSTARGVVEFFSFADFSHAFALLHPNWPENIFGKAYFLQPEFLVIPLIAFGVLLARTRRSIHALAALALMGVFMAKGAQEPFGGLYAWLFEHIPGFVILRDPTKWYVWIVIGYSVLFSHGVARVAGWLYEKKHQNIATAIILCALVVWGFTIREALTGALPGTLSHQLSQPHSSRQLYEYLRRDGEFSRVLVFPQRSTYTPVSAVHPVMDALSYDKESSMSSVLDWMGTDEGRETLRRHAIGYIVVEPMENGETRSQITDRLATVPWATMSARLGGIDIYKTDNPLGHVWYESDTGTLVNIGHERHAAWEYDVLVDPTSQFNGQIVFSEQYHPGWMLHVGDRSVNPERTKDGLMAFAVSGSADEALRLEFVPQRSVYLGLRVSLFAVVGLGGCWLALRSRGNTPFVSDEEVGIIDE